MIRKEELADAHRPPREDGGGARLSAWIGNTNLKRTEKMSLSSSTIDWGVFKQKFCAYTDSEAWQHKPSNKTVKDLLMSALDTDLYDRVKKSMSDTATREENLNVIEEEIEGINPIINRRISYYKEKKQKGESDLTYANRMVNLGEDCQMLEMPIEEHLAAHQLAQHSDELRAYINLNVNVTTTFPTLNQINQYAKELERTQKLDELLGDKDPLHAKRACEGNR